MGFYDTLHYVLGGAAEAKTTLMSRVWKVYETLLQYCCLTDFKTITAKMVEDKASAIAAMEDDFAEYKKQYDAENAHTLERLKETERQFEILVDAKSEAELNQAKAER